MIYRQRFDEISGIDYRGDLPNVKHNYYNFVITVNEQQFGMNRDKLYTTLRKYNIITRKYFYPLCSQFQCYKHYPSSSPENLPVAERITKSVLTLPLYGNLKEDDVNKICDIIEFYS